MKSLACLLGYHDWDVERVQLEHGKFISLGLCHQCRAQYWLKGEIGEFKGVRIIKSEGETRE